MHESRVVISLLARFADSHFQPGLPRKLALLSHALAEIEKQPGSLSVISNPSQDMFECQRTGSMSDNDLVLLRAFSRNSKVFAVVECRAHRPVVVANLPGQQTSHRHKRLTTYRQRHADDVQVVGQKK